MKKIRQNTQLSLINPKGAGRPAIHDKGIRHRERIKFNKASSFHLTIKVRENKADIQTKRILKSLHHGIKRARLKGLRIIHYTLEYNHVHLLVECTHHSVLHRSMQALGISFAKNINKVKTLKGNVYKHRYHQRKITSSRELKNVLHYIFQNGIKHKRTKSRIDPYNSLIAETLLAKLYPREAKLIWADMLSSSYLLALQRELILVLHKGEVFFKGLNFIS